MIVQIKDLKPNPFRDMENYPINEKKVQNLIDSINQTGFWDNILARRNNGKIEIAYGHHRLKALWKIYGKASIIVVNIPIKKLNDKTMIKIMANENMNEWGTNTAIIDETIKVTKNYLLNHKEIVEEIENGLYQFKANVHITYEISAKIISEFLGSKLWYVQRVSDSLKRLKLEKEGKLDKKALEELPHEKAAQIFTRQVESIKSITPRQQKRAAKRIIERQDFSEYGIKSVLLDEKYSKKKTKKEQWERNVIELKNIMIKCTKDMKSLNDNFLELSELQTKYNINFETFRGSKEADDFKSEMLILIGYLKKFSKEGGEKDVEKKLFQISD